MKKPNFLVLPLLRVVHLACPDIHGLTSLQQLYLIAPTSAPVVSDTTPVVSGGYHRWSPQHSPSLDAPRQVSITLSDQGVFEVFG